MISQIKIYSKDVSIANVKFNFLILNFMRLVKQLNYTDYHLYFTVFDTHHMLNVPFNGNFTIKVVGGGRGVYQKNNSNFRFFTQKEIEKFNYIPGKRLYYCSCNK